MSRPPSEPPVLPGFSYLQPLGAGGFADVFLYEQQMPRRKVAVKVLLADRLSTGAAQEFTDEANVMAMLSTHPAIVTIYQAGVAGDGRPYLVMEYCSRPNLQVRSRREPFSVAEALRVGIQVAGAVETAHRAGVLHRDIKPANILVTEYNRPALTDFGIATTAGAVNEAAGMSIPWSPPESFAEPPASGPRTDVYALGATIFTLLASRSPFERPGERNTSADLIERIERMAVPKLDRADSPSSLQAVLERAMAKNPDDRYPSAVAFARALQKVQIELAHSVTPIDIVDEHPSADELEDDDDGLTRVREVRSISPQGEAENATRPSARTERKAAPVIGDIPRFDPASAPAAAVEQTQLRASSSAPQATPTAAPDHDEQTLLRPPRVVAPVASAPAPAPQAPASASPHETTAAADAPRVRKGVPWWGWVLMLVGAVLVVGGVIWASSLAADGIGSQTTKTPPPSEPEAKDPMAGLVPPVEDLVGTRSGDVVTFTWKNADPQEGDTFLWNQVTLDGPSKSAQVTEPKVVLPGPNPDRTCIEVIVKRDNGTSSPEVRECVD
ncbi:protein kinase domain-containing protein [Microbacterium esteraromaticum]|uniref:protein kinase domain-containing protein n=1 Tax=Microbacterium esteraromaticum TaxID=57043 RepID=UPI00195C1CFC|nr:serine/threonine protein kinase [Microbacterium esteraromaticum]